MALIECVECGKQVSSLAAACPGCGVAIAGRSEQRAAGAPLTTIQETSKRLKLHSLGAMLMLAVGLVLMFTRAGESTGFAGVGMASMLVFVGLLWYLVTRARIWWHHK